MALVLLTSAASVESAPASDGPDDLKISQFGHTGWTQRDGAPARVLALAQTSDGLLWLGSSTGLFRFDGSVFSAIDRVGTASVGNAPIDVLAADHDGGLWYGRRREGGLHHVKGTELAHLPLEAGVVGVSAILVDAQDVAWAIANDKLWRIDRRRPAPIDATWGLPGGIVKHIVLDRSGQLFVSVLRAGGTGDLTLFRLPSGARRFVSGGPLQEGTPYVAPDGTVWVNNVNAMYHRPQGVAPDGVDATPFKRFDVKPMGDILVAQDGAVWAMRLGGLGRSRSFDELANGPEPELYGADRGLTSAIVRTLFSDRDGNVWVGTDGGLDRFRRLRFTTIALQSRGGAALAPAPAGGVWAGTYDRGLFRIDNNVVTNIASVGLRISALNVTPEGRTCAGGGNFHVWCDDATGEFAKLPVSAAELDKTVSSQTSAVARDRSGVLRIGHYLEANSFRFMDGTWTRFAPPAMPDHARTVTALALDGQGRLWQSHGNVVVMFDGEQPHKVEGVPDIGEIDTLHAHGSRMWLGGKSGLALSERGRILRIVARDGTPFTMVTGVLERSNGDVWVREQQDAFVIRAAQLEGPNDGVGMAVDVERFGERDGLPRNNYRPQSVVEAADGNLWFSYDSGVAYADPKMLRHESRVVPVRLLSFTANGKSFPVDGAPRLDELNERIELAFSAIDLSAGDGRRFRYRLDGVDHAWRDAGPGRTATYNDLPPGPFAFRVQVADDRGRWLDEGATLRFLVPPAWFQTGWFRTACALLAAALLWQLHRWRARHLMRQAEARLRLRLEARTAERGRIARDLHDTLLQGTTGLVLNFQVALNAFSKEDPRRRQMESILDEADRAMVEARVRVTGLRSEAPNGGDLRQAIQAIVDATPRGETTCECVQDGEPWDLAPEVRDQLLLIVREVLTNAFRHAGAATVHVALSSDRGRRIVRISDDGVGFDYDDAMANATTRGHWGLFGLHERVIGIGAQLDVRSRPGQGTEFRITLPSDEVRRRWMRWGPFGPTPRREHQ